MPVFWRSLCCLTSKHAIVDATRPLFPPSIRPVSAPKILIAERCLLHTLGFQMTVEHPYAAVMGLLKKLFSLGRGADGGKGVDKALNRQLSQVKTTSLWFCNWRGRNEVARGGGVVDPPSRLPSGRARKRRHDILFQNVKLIASSSRCRVFGCPSVCSVEVLFVFLTWYRYGRVFVETCHALSA